MNTIFYKKDITLIGFNENRCPIRHIQSFNRRHRCLTKRQRGAFEKYWSTIGIEFREQILNFTALFGRDAPVILEIGFGTGESLITMAKEHPEYNFLGIDVYLPGISTCLISVFQEDIKNLRIMCHDAVEVLNKMIPEDSLSMIQLFFPDPWQKKRHNKRRIVQISFAKLIKNKLKIGGIFHIATDWKPYAEHILQVMSLLSEYKNQSISNDYVSRPASRPETKFERRSYRFGHSVLDLMFERIK